MPTVIVTEFSRFFVMCAVVDKKITIAEKEKR